MSVHPIVLATIRKHLAEAELRLKEYAETEVKAGTAKARVITFKPSGKYYTQHEWLVPADAIGPHDMRRSPDFKLAPGWTALVVTQEPWGFPCLLNSEEKI